MVEPSRSDGHVALCRHPLIAVGMSLLQLVVFLIAWEHVASAQERPVGGMGVTLFVAHPSAARSAVREHDALRLQLVNQLVGAVVLVVCAAVDGARFLGTAIPSVAAVGSIEPNLEDVAVAREQLTQLVVEVVHIKRRAVESLVPVPGREVYAKLQSVFLACRGQFAHHVALSVLVRRVAYAVVGVVGGPQAEAVVMLGRDDDTFQSRLDKGLRPLLAIEPGGVEGFQFGVAVPPFAVVEGVQAKMDEGVCLHLLPPHLMLGGDGHHRCGCLVVVLGMYCHTAGQRYGQNEHPCFHIVSFLLYNVYCQLLVVFQYIVNHVYDSSCLFRFQRVFINMCACLLHAFLFAGAFDASQGVSLLLTIMLTNDCSAIYDERTSGPLSTWSKPNSNACCLYRAKVSG